MVSSTPAGFKEIEVGFQLAETPSLPPHSALSGVGFVQDFIIQSDKEGKNQAPANSCGQSSPGTAGDFTQRLLPALWQNVDRQEAAGSGQQVRTGL